MIVLDTPDKKRIDGIGFKVLNGNKIEKRIVFSYAKDDKLYKGVPEVTKRQIVIYDCAYKYTEGDDEVAAMLKVSKMTLHRWDKNGVLKKIEVGGHRRYRRSDVEAVTLNRKDA